MTNKIHGMNPTSTEYQIAKSIFVGVHRVNANEYMTYEKIIHQTLKQTLSISNSSLNSYSERNNAAVIGLSLILHTD